MSTFYCELDMQAIGLSSFFEYYRFTVVSKIHTKWQNYDEYLQYYKLMIEPGVYDNVSDSVGKILKDMFEYHDFYFEVQQNKGEAYIWEDKTPNIICIIGRPCLEFFKRVFISTIVYAAQKKKFPENEHETIGFLFDTDKKTVTITGIRVYEPDDPYFEYARNAVRSLSVEAIKLSISGKSRNKEKIKDFYEWDNISAWKERKEIFDDNISAVLTGAAGIYMLYNADKNTFYVGKAKSLRERIIQHAKDVTGKDAMQDFTHYRYSTINMEYYEYLYLIENAAIHDCAMIINMPKAKKLNKPLIRIAKRFSRSLDDCKMVNTHERQRKAEQ